jgi:hypothetical protein
MLRVPSTQQCLREFGVVRLAADQLLTGLRPSPSHLFASQRWPVFAGSAALRREYKIITFRRNNQETRKHALRLTK